MPIIKNPFGAAYTVAGSVKIDNEVIMRHTAPEPESAVQAEKAPTAEEKEAAESTAAKKTVRKEAELAAEKLRSDAEKELERARSFAVEEYERTKERCEELRAKAAAEAAQIMSKAKDAASELVAKTKEASESTMQEAELAAVKLRADAEEQGHKKGYDEGYAEGEKKGHDEGYVKGLKKCSDTLIELKNLIEEITAEKAEIFKANERKMFDLIFDIAQKITLDSLKQKEKGVITKMLKEAGKEFRSSANVKITLSELDVDNTAEFAEEVQGFFVDSQHIEFEILKDAPSGTLVLDNGSEITDASVSTQLKMIEELGRGKYRDKPSAEVEE